MLNSLVGQERISSTARSPTKMSPSPLTFNMVSEKSNETDGDDMKIEIQSKKLSF